MSVNRFFYFSEGGHKVQIKKILNNNAVITKDLSNKEIIVLGKGIAYGKRNGDKIQSDKIYKIFSVKSKNVENKLSEIIEKIPIKYIELTEEIVQIAQDKLNIQLDDGIYVSLTDHIYSSIQRYKEGIPLKNKLLWETKHFYKDEFEVGLDALELIKKYTGITMLEDEASFIAMHIISSEMEQDIHSVYDLTYFIQPIVNIVKYYFSLDLDLDSLTYFRFITHLKFFGQRILLTETSDNKVSLIENDLLEIIKTKYKGPYLCSLKIKKYIEEKYDYYLDSDEILYLTIHIARILKDS